MKEMLENLARGEIEFYTTVRIHMFGLIARSPPHQGDARMGEDNPRHTAHQGRCLTYHSTCGNRFAFAIQT